MGAEHSSEHSHHKSRRGNLNSMYPTMTTESFINNAHGGGSSSGGPRASADGTDSVADNSLPPMRSLSEIQRDRERRRRERERIQPTGEDNVQQPTHSQHFDPAALSSPAPREGEGAEEEADGAHSPEKVPGVAVENKVRPRNRLPKGIVEIRNTDQIIRINFDKLPDKLPEAEPPPLTREELQRLEEERNRVASPQYYGRAEYMDRCSPTSPNLRRFGSFLSHHDFFPGTASVAGTTGAPSVQYFSKAASVVSAEGGSSYRDSPYLGSKDALVSPVKLSLYSTNAAARHSNLNLTHNHAFSSYASSAVSSPGLVHLDSPNFKAFARSQGDSSVVESDFHQSQHQGEYDNSSSRAQEQEDENEEGEFVLEEEEEWMLDVEDHLDNSLHPHSYLPQGAQGQAHFGYGSNYSSGAEITKQQSKKKSKRKEERSTTERISKATSPPLNKKKSIENGMNESYGSRTKKGKRRTRQREINADADVLSSTSDECLGDD